MGKSLPPAAHLRSLATRIAVAASDTLRPPKSARPRPAQFQISTCERKVRHMEGGPAERRGSRVPLSEVVTDCVRRWFQDTLKEARAGDSAMQVLVGQMYYSGYGVTRDLQKGRAWMTRASKTRSSVWKVSDKHPGYNASDSDSDEVKGDAK